MQFTSALRSDLRERAGVDTFPPSTYGYQRDRARYARVQPANRTPCHYATAGLFRFPATMYAFDVNHAAPMRDDREDTERREISRLLDSGLETTTEPFPETDKEFHAILRELKSLDPEDLAGKLRIAGFLNRPYGADMMRCRECTYYLIRRKRCDLPEIGLPVEPDWWCRLWRI